VRWRADNQQADKGDVAIIVDVLRACTNLITAFSMGAKRCKVSADVGEARRLAGTTDAILIGERHNEKMEGFDYGNSPLELEQQKIENSTIIFTSTNFPHALSAAGQASYVLLGALVNLSAVCERALSLAIRSDSNIALMLAGELCQSYAVEDYYFAARASTILSTSCVVDASAQKAINAAGNRSKQDIISLSLHARELIDAGFEADVRYAFVIDKFDIVPRLVQGWIVAD
jgi:2-phosphosulfolactate phosphatase